MARVAIFRSGQGLEQTNTLESVSIFCVSDGANTQKLTPLAPTDLAEVSIEQARDRWEHMRSPRFRAAFFAADCFEVNSNRCSSLLASFADLCSTDAN